MKAFIHKTFIFLGIFSLVMGMATSYGSQPGYAENLELIGQNLGLEVSPSDKLFNLNNLNPGDTVDAEIDIRNNYSRAFNLQMRAERIGETGEEDEIDLFNQLEITVFYGEDEIYTGPMSGFALENIDLGRYNPGSQKTLKARVHLPGPDTGNEFQGTGFDVKWIFMAQADRPSNPDPDPEPERINIRVTKEWAEDHEGIDEVTVFLVNNPSQSLVLGEANNWTGQFTGLAKYDSQGNEIIYTIGEERLEGYEEPEITGNQENGFTVINRKEEEEEIDEPIPEGPPETIDIEVKKEWEGSHEGIDSITIFLENDPDQKLVLREADGWTGKFTGLAKYDSDENEIVYTIGEERIEGYEEPEISGNQEDGFTVVNRKEEEEEVDEPIPEGRPDPDDPKDPEETVDGKVPEGRPKGPRLPKTGSKTSLMYYGLGLIFLLLGFKTRRVKTN